MMVGTHIDSETYVNLEYFQLNSYQLRINGLSHFQNLDTAYQSRNTSNIDSKQTTNTKRTSPEILSIQ